MSPWFQRLVQLVTWTCFLVLFRVRRVDPSNLPREGSVLLVANHASHLDPPIIGCLVNRKIWFIARATLGKFRLGDFLLRKLGVIFIDRDAPSRTALQEAIECLRADRLLLMFPEGTRTRDGTVGEFRRGLSLILKRTPDTMVVPIGLRGTGRAFPRGKVLPRPRSCEVHFGTPIPAAEVLAAGGLDRLRARVAELAAVPLAELETETESVVTRSARSSAASTSSTRGTDGPAAAENKQRTS